MKIKPELFLIKKESILYKKILVTGSDESFISYVTEHIVKRYKNNNYFIDSSGIINQGLVGNLFSDKKVLFLLKDYSSKKDMPEISKNFAQCILISCTNNKKISGLKAGFLNSKTSLLIECYPLNRGSKEDVLKNFIEKNNLNLSNDVYWYVVENFENEYVLFVKQLHSLSLFNTEINSISDLEKIVFVENKIEINKIFFHIFKSNKMLVKIFNSNIFSHGDFYVFLNTLKIYLNIISESKNKQDALIKFPRYLFNEKDIFLKVYDSLDKKKIIKIYNNIFKAEKIIRKNAGLYNMIGLRFLINTKQIITS